MWTNYSLCSVSNKEMLKVDFLGCSSPTCSVWGQSQFTTTQLKQCYYILLRNLKICDFRFSKQRIECTNVRATEVREALINF